MQKQKAHGKGTNHVPTRDRGVSHISSVSILISDHIPQFMLAVLDHSPDIYLDEIQAQLSEMHDLNVSLATIYRTLKRLGIGSKKVSLPSLFWTLTILSLPYQLSKAAAERSEEARRAFRLEIGAEPPERIVTADESAVNILTTYRQNGWSYRGIRARKKCKFVRGTRYVLCWSLRCSN